jgi:hypothetical protein
MESPGSRKRRRVTGVYPSIMLQAAASAHLAQRWQLQGWQMGGVHARNGLRGLLWAVGIISVIASCPLRSHPQFSPGAASHPLVQRACYNRDPLHDGSVPWPAKRDLNANVSRTLAQLCGPWTPAHRLLQPLHGEKLLLAQPMLSRRRDVQQVRVAATVCTPVGPQAAVSDMHGLR